MSAVAEQVAGMQHDTEGNQRRVGLRLVGGWQSDKDMPHRRKILSRIVIYLQQRNPNGRPEWVKKIPLMAKRLEDSLYRNAASFAEYNDMNTLRARLQALASRLSHKTHHKQQAGQAKSGGGAAPAAAPMAAAAPSSLALAAPPWRR